MPYKIVEKLAKLEPYEPIKGNYSVRLDANESFINLNDDIKAQIASAVAEVDFNRYPESTAETARKAFAEFYGVNSDNVVAGNGSDEIISIITSTMLEKGDIILTLAPDFSMYHFYGDIYEADVRVIKKEDDLTISVDAILDTAKQIGAKAVVFSNPAIQPRLFFHAVRFCALFRQPICL